MNNISKHQYLSIGQLQDQYLNQKNTDSKLTTTNGLSFEDILRQTQNSEVRFSKHASNRLNDRNIELSTEQLERLNDATKKASEKGIKDSLVLLDELAFIVNTSSNTVITAMDQTETKENIFTNIDGAIII